MNYVLELTRVYNEKKYENKSDRQRFLEMVKHSDDHTYLSDMVMILEDEVKHLILVADNLDEAKTFDRLSEAQDFAKRASAVCMQQFKTEATFEVREISEIDPGFVPGEQNV